MTIPLMARTPDVTEQCLNTVFDEPAPATLIRFAEQWLKNRHGRLMPSLADMDPTTMSWAPAKIFILKRNENGRFYYHLVGDRLPTRLGGAVKGRTADQLFEPDFARDVEYRWNKSAADRMIYVITSNRNAAGMASAIAHRITLPLFSDGRTVDRLIGVLEYPKITKDIPALHIPKKVTWTSVEDLAR